MLGGGVNSFFVASVDLATHCERSFGHLTQGSSLNVSERVVEPAGMISTQHPEYGFVEQNKKRFDLLKFNEPEELRKVLTKELTVKRLRSN